MTTAGVPYFRGTAPRGVAAITDTMRAVFRQWQEGVPRAELARIYQVAPKTITTWVRRVHEADRDARLHGGSHG